MSPKTMLLLTAGVAAVYLPLPVSAQEYRQPGGDESYQTATTSRITANRTETRHMAPGETSHILSSPVVIGMAQAV